MSTAALKLPHAALFVIAVGLRRAGGSAGALTIMSEPSAAAVYADGQFV